MPEFHATDVTLPIAWRLAEPGSSRYATHLFIQRNEDEFVLTFFEVQPPLIFDDAEAGDVVRQARGECVARLIVSPQQMAEMVEMFRRIPTQTEHEKDGQ